MPDLLPWLFGAAIGLLSAGASVHMLSGRPGRCAICLAGLGAIVAAARWGVTYAA